MVASHDVGTSLQSLSASPDQRLCCVGGRDVLQIVRLEHENDDGFIHGGGAETLAALPLPAAANGASADLSQQVYSARFNPRTSSLHPGATVRSERVKAG